ncbi:winged helix-turn-helix transcriptional regulator [Leptotrichia sp. OH3620_COT-345]|uniref:replication/maintenance protein RepL n=1 Tax=Leptotrichia sp. OH3620_COT-345 TaxID=2491048 RepID=UPI000F647ABF|nr:replication/maintenance protein RepL [Leptotrichia sp. OH3620_COT-345]RRD35974.1 winged helix-turn-helix transcriptional regulator [Leptotrichia sp. OH3620_COT-345]
MKNEKITSKKVKVLGTQQYINANTGELEDFQVTSLQDRDFNFTKVWLNSILQTLDMLGNQKTKVAYHIIDNLNKENQYIGTQRQIAERVGISLKTVSITVKALLNADFLRNLSNGVYCVNPDVLFKGSRTSRLNVLQQYNTAEKPKVSDEEKIANLEKVIATAQKEIQKLKYKSVPIREKTGTDN